MTSSVVNRPSEYGYLLGHSSAIVMCTKIVSQVDMLLTSKSDL